MTAQRIPYHEIDGSRMETTFGGEVAQAVIAAATNTTSDPVELQKLNNEASDFWISPNYANFGWRTAFRLILPEAFTIDGYHIVWAGEGGSYSERYIYTRDATTGTWTSRGSVARVTDHAQWPNVVSTGPWSNVDGVAFTCQNQGANVYALSIHVYGTPDNTAGRLRLWDPTLDQEYGSGLDFGILNPGDVSTIQVRVKNTHGTDTANGVVLSAYDLSDDMADGITFSDDDVTYTTTLNIGNLTSGAISPVTYIRRTVPDPVTYMSRASWIAVEPTSWT